MKGLLLYCVPFSLCRNAWGHPQEQWGCTVSGRLLTAWDGVCGVTGREPLGEQGKAGGGAEILDEAGDHEQWVLVLTTQGRHSA